MADSRYFAARLASEWLGVSEFCDTDDMIYLMKFVLPSVVTALHLLMADMDEHGVLRKDGDQTTFRPVLRMAHHLVSKAQCSAPHTQHYLTALKDMVTQLEMTRSSR